MFTTDVCKLMRNYCALILIILNSCNSEDPFPLDPVRGIVAADNGNEGDGSDLEVFVSEQLENDNVREYRAIVSKVSNTALTLSEANGTAFFESATPDEIFPIQGIVFSADSRDTDGDVLVENLDYQIGVLSIASDQKERSNSFFLIENTFRLTQNNQIADFTRSFDGGAGSLTLNSEGKVVMGDYNIVGELSGDESETYELFQFGNDGAVSVLRGPYRMLGGNTRDQNGNIYQSILDRARVLKIGPNAEQQTIVLDNTRVSGNDGVFINSVNELFVVNPESATVLKWNIDTGENSILAQIPESPRGITGDENGNLYISHNHEDGVITRISAEGEVSELARIPTFRPEFYTIEYLMWVGYLTYHQGSLYVAGMSTDRVYKVSLTGEVEVFVGSGTRGTPVGGALTANLNRPKGVVFSEDGSTLYISGSTDNVPQHTQASTPVQIWEVSIIEE